MTFVGNVLGTTVRISQWFPAVAFPHYPDHELNLLSTHMVLVLTWTSSTARRNTSNLRYADDTTLMAKSKEELKSLLIKVKEESEKAGLKLNIQKTKIMVSSLITSWQIDGNSDRLFFFGSKITEDGDYSHEIKRHLLLGRKAMTSLDSILKSRGITFLTKVHLVKAMVFPIVMYRCESWTINKAEDQRIDAFEVWCWRKLLRVSWTARRSNQSILKEINPEYSLEGLMLKLKLQYCGHMMWRADSLEKTLRLGKTEGRRRRGQQRMMWLDGIIDSMDVSLSRPQERVKGREGWHVAVHGVAKSRTWPSDWKAKAKLDSVISLQTWEEISGEEEKGSICVRTAWIPLRHKLWKSKQPPSKRWCASALCCLSCEASARCCLVQG